MEDGQNEVHLWLETMSIHLPAIILYTLLLVIDNSVEWGFFLEEIYFLEWYKIVGKKIRKKEKAKHFLVNKRSKRSISLPAHMCQNVIGCCAQEDNFVLLKSTQS